MGLEISVVRPGDVRADVLAVAVTEPVEPLTAQAASLDARLNGQLAELAKTGEIAGEPGEASVLRLDGEVGAPRVAAAGVGDASKVDADAIRTAAAAVGRAVGRFGGTVAWVLDDSLPLPESEQARAVVEGIVLGTYYPGRWKTRERLPKEVERIQLVSESAGGIAEAAERAARVAAWSNRARDLANAPPNELTPEALAARAEEIAASSEHVTAEPLGPEEIERLGMGAFAAVGRGSHNTARMIVLRYDPPAAARQDVTLGLVGKAITFDSGGISIKPALKMEDMKGDMAGGGAVVEGLGAIADLGLPVRAIAVVAAC